MKRRTIQKDMIINALNDLHHPSAKDVYKQIISSYPYMSKGTVYRNLAQMVADGQIQHIKMHDGADHYDHTLSAHYHCKCSTCGRVFDMEIPYKNELNLVQGANGFVTQDHTLIFSGLCADCFNLKENEKND